MAPATYTLREVSNMLNRPINTIHSWIKRNREDISHIKTESGEILIDENAFQTLQTMSDSRPRINKSCSKKSIGQDHLVHHGKKMHSISYVCRKLKRSDGTIYGWIANEGISHESIGNRLYVDDDGFEKLKRLSNQRRRVNNKVMSKRAEGPAKPIPKPQPAPQPQPQPQPDKVNKTISIEIDASDARMIDALGLDVEEVANKAVSEYIDNFKRKIKDIL